MRKVKEDTQSSVSLNNVGSGSIEGIGVGPRGEPGVSSKTKNLANLLKNDFSVLLINMHFSIYIKSNTIS